MDLQKLLAFLILGSFFVSEILAIAYVFFRLDYLANAVALVFAFFLVVMELEIQWRVGEFEKALNQSLPRQALGKILWMVFTLALPLLGILVISTNPIAFIIANLFLFLFVFLWTESGPHPLMMALCYAAIAIGYLFPMA